MDAKRLFIVGEIGYNWSDYEKVKLFQADAAPLEVFIDSGGGSVTAGNAFSALLRAHAQNYNVEVRTIGVGIVASIATSILLAGTKVEMDIQCSMMIHNPSVSWFSGDAEQMRQTADTLDVIKNTLIDMYVRRIEKSGKATANTRKEIIKMMDAETWLNAQQALDLGLIDAVQTFEAQAAEAQTMVQAMPAPQQEQYQTIVNKFKNQTKTTMQTPENKTEEQIGKSFVAWFKGLFVNQTAPEAVATPTPEPIAEVTPTPEVIAVKAIADMTDEEIEAEAAKRKAQKTATADPAVAALEAKMKAMEQELALHKAKAIVPQNAAPVAKEMNDAQKKAYAFLDRIKSCPDVAKSFNASNQN